MGGGVQGTPFRASGRASASTVHALLLHDGRDSGQGGPSGCAHTEPVSSSDRLLARRVVGAYTGATIAAVAPVVGHGDVNQVHVVTTGDGSRFVVRSNKRAELDR